MQRRSFLKWTTHFNCLFFRGNCGVETRDEEDIMPAASARSCPPACPTEVSSSTGWVFSYSLKYSLYWHNPERSFFFPFTDLKGKRGEELPADPEKEQRSFWTDVTSEPHGLPVQCIPPVLEDISPRSTSSFQPIRAETTPSKCLIFRHK